MAKNQMENHDLTVEDYLNRFNSYRNGMRMAAVDLDYSPHTIYVPDTSQFFPSFFRPHFSNDSYSAFRKSDLYFNKLTIDAYCEDQAVKPFEFVVVESIILECLLLIIAEAEHLQRIYGNKEVLAGLSKEWNKQRNGMYIATSAELASEVEEFTLKNVSPNSLQSAIRLEQFLRRSDVFTWSEKLGPENYRTLSDRVADDQQQLQSFLNSHRFRKRGEDLLKFQIRNWVDARALAITPMLDETFTNDNIQYVGPNPIRDDYRNDIPREMKVLVERVDKHVRNHLSPFFYLTSEKKAKLEPERYSSAQAALTDADSIVKNAVDRIKYRDLGTKSHQLKSTEYHAIMFANSIVQEFKDCVGANISSEKESNISEDEADLLDKAFQSESSTAEMLRDTEVRLRDTAKSIFENVPEFRDERFIDRSDLKQVHGEDSPVVKRLRELGFDV